MNARYVGDVLADFVLNGVVGMAVEADAVPEGPMVFRLSTRPPDGMDWVRIVPHPQLLRPNGDDEFLVNAKPAASAALAAAATAAAPKVATLLKYQLGASPAIVPLRIRTRASPAEGRTDVLVEYVANPSLLQPLHGATITVRLNGVPSNVQAKPEATTIGANLVWSLGTMTATDGPQRLMARVFAPDGGEPCQPVATDASFSGTGGLSGTTVDPTFRPVDGFVLKQGTVGWLFETGTFTALPDDTSGSGGKGQAS